MTTNFFNKWEFRQALNLAETNPVEAKTLYEEYLKKYPKDYSAYPYYCTVLVTLGEFAAAEKNIRIYRRYM